MHNNVQDVPMGFPGDSWITILVALAIVYAMIAAFCGVQALECSHGRTGRKADLRIVWEAVAWIVTVVPWREWLGMSLPNSRHSMQMKAVW